MLPGEGFLITVLIKWLILMTARRFYYRAFFRAKPALANFVGVVVGVYGATLSFLPMYISKLGLSLTLLINAA